MTHKQYCSGIPCVCDDAFSVEVLHRYSKIRRLDQILQVLEDDSVIKNRVIIQFMIDELFEIGEVVPIYLAQQSHKEIKKYIESLIRAASDVQESLYHLSKDKATWERYIPLSPPEVEENKPKKAKLRQLLILGGVGESLSTYKKRLFDEGWVVEQRISRKGDKYGGYDAIFIAGGDKSLDYAKKVVIEEGLPAFIGPKITMGWLLTSLATLKKGA